MQWIMAFYYNIEHMGLRGIAYKLINYYLCNTKTNVGFLDENSLL